MGRFCFIKLSNERKRMLRELRLNNLAIIKNLDLEFSRNFVALTGETGAGKSIILDGISLLIGESFGND